MEKTKSTDSGKPGKIKAKYCPKCEDKIMVMLKDGETEVFECENCKFKVKR